MSQTESGAFLSEADNALSSGRYDHAADHYVHVIRGLSEIAQVGRPHTSETRVLAQHYVAASRGHSAALDQLGQIDAAEQTLLAAIDYLRSCINNIATPVHERAVLLTEYKLCFYALAGLLLDHDLADRLQEFVGFHSPELLQWASDLNLVKKNRVCEN